VSEAHRAASFPHPATVPGPTLSFGFNLGKVPDHGEDSDPILRDGPDLGLVAVFDGMGGAGGTVYETPEGRRTGAYLASRIARDVVERRMLDLLEPDWNLNGEAAAEDLRGSVQQALRERLEDLDAPPSGLRSRLLRSLPTTMAVVALQRTQPGGSTWACHLLWAGDSRAYVFEPAGARQLTTDDLRHPVDAMANLHQDSVVSNAMSADTDFHVNYRRIELRAPFLVACATDGCFGYMSTPMHFEHLVLSSLQHARTTTAWSASLQSEITDVTGDDAAMSMMGVGATLKEFQALFAPRVAELEEQFIAPLDEVTDAVAQAERELEGLRQRQLATTTAIWSRYKVDYERYLQPSDDAAEVDPADHTATPGNPPDGAATGDDEPGAADATLDGQNSEETP
jgi:serine/threonine protein phosphatase PrpC